MQRPDEKRSKKARTIINQSPSAVLMKNVPQRKKQPLNHKNTRCYVAQVVVENIFHIYIKISDRATKGTFFFIE